MSIDALLQAAEYLERRERGNNDKSSRMLVFLFCLMSRNRGKGKMMTSCLSERKVVLVVGLCC